ncbi:Hypothetical protein NocV09_01101370 [Nannochloropsis oceanica]
MAAITATVTTEAGRRLRDMLQVLEKRAPYLRPNLIPKSCKPFMDLAAMCSTEAQRQAVQRVLAQQRRKAGGAAGEEGGKEEVEGGQRLAIQVHVSVDSGACNIFAVKYLSEVEADLYCVETILNMHSRGDNDELRLRLEHFLSVNGHDSGDIADAQEIYSLAYAIIICLSAAPFKVTVGSQGLQLPLDSTVDAGAVIEMLFEHGKPCEYASIMPKTSDMKQRKMKKNKK